MHMMASKRLLFSCLYLGAMFLVAGTLFYRVQGFQGVMLLQQGAAEHLAFRAASGGIGVGVAQRNVFPDLLLFDNPRAARVLRQDQHYDAMLLPVALRLDDVEIIAEHPARHTLSMEGPSGTRQLPIDTGTRVELGDDTLEVTGIGTWEGLVRTGTGRPMAAVALGAMVSFESPMIFLEADRWRLLGPDMALQFQWHASEAALQEAVHSTLDTLGGARWGLRDGKAIQWFESFTPGTGARLRDGTRVALAEDHRAEGWVSLRVIDGSGERLERVEANQAGDALPYLLEDPLAADRVLQLHAWREDQVHARLWRRGESEPVQTLAPGDVWALAPGELTLDLRQVMADAVAVPGGKVFAAYAQAGGRRYALREGLAENIGEYRVQYVREQPPPDARYAVAALDPAGDVVETVHLAAGDRARIGAWVVSLAGENPFAPAGIAMDVARRPGGFAQLLGLVLFAAGSFGLVLVRFSGKGRADADGV